MSLQKKIVTLFVVLGIVFSLGSFAGLSAFVFPTFEDFEQQSAEQSLSRVRRALDTELRALEVINREYSEWDQTHDFALGRRDSYVEENLDIAYWTSIDIIAMMYFDLNGDLLWGAVVDLALENVLPIDEELEQPLTADHPLMQHLENPGVDRGILRARTAPLLVSSRPILTSSADGPAAGTLVIAKFLDPTLVTELGERASVEATLFALDDPNVPEGLLDELVRTGGKSNLVTWSFTDDFITGNQVISDVFGKPAFVLKVSSPRTIIEIGRNVIATALVFFLAATGVFLLGAWIFTRNLIVAPVTSLTKHISRMRRTGDLERSLQSNRGDEIGILEKEFADLARGLNLAQIELESARDQALAISNAKSDFLAKMSHEIRTPMNGVLGMIELLQNTPLDRTQKRYMHSIMESADNLLEIISDILDISKIEAGKLTLETRAFNLNSFITDISDSLSGLAERKGLRLNTIAPDGPPINIKTDPLRLRQVLTNLVGNAIKFTEKGHVLISVSTTPDIGDFVHIKFEIIDTGIGIAPRKQQQIFESFTQEDGSTTRRYGGTGLGLTICKQLVELMGGSIQLVSEPGQGSSFSFTLRLLADRSGDMTSIENTFTHVYGELDGNMLDLMPLKGRVLVAEDNAVNQAVAIGMLTAMGVESVLAKNGEEVVDLYRTQPFDAVLMDCQMPVIDGFQATEEIRKIEKHKGHDPIRIIAVTANALASDMERCIAAGMDDYLRKPYKCEQLNAALVKVLQPGELPEPTASKQESPILLDDNTLEGFSDPIDDIALDSLTALPQSGDQNLVNRVIQTYINSSMDLLTRLGEAIDRSDSDCIRTTAHSLKSCSANVGATALVELCAAMETSTRRSDRATAATLQRQIKEEYPRVVEALKQKLAAAAA
jgi:signal transduction histidine kinase/DNA-binding NarL/FixJ family response regulator